MGSREFFEAHAEPPLSGEKCKVLQAQPEATNLEWEQEVASRHSPEPVANGEMLARYWLNPVHYDSVTGALKPTAFDDASNKGLSVNRLGLVDPAGIEAMAAARVRDWNALNPGKVQRTLIGYSDFSAADVRAVVAAAPEVRRAFGVYDTAKADDVSHADVCQIVASNQGGRSARSQLRELANGRLKSF